MKDIEAIKIRSSCRNYDGRVLEDDTRKTLESFLRQNTTGLFGSRLHFRLIFLGELAQNEARSLGTYGTIKGAETFIAGTVEKNTMCMEDFGYGMERNILLATKLGLGTCWLGGSFRRRGFAALVLQKKNELMPAVSPVGYAAKKGSLADRLIRHVAKSDKRKSWPEIFYHGSFETPLSREEAGEYSLPIESVRRGPSASNKQPWRIVKEKGKEVFHFYLERTDGYGNIGSDVRLQNIDMGIALCHFECASEELGLKGSWQKEKIGADSEKLLYIATWIHDS